MTQSSPPPIPRPSDTYDPTNTYNPDSSQPQEHLRQSYSPLSEADEEMEDPSPIRLAPGPMSSSGSSELSDIDDMDSQNTNGSAALSLNDELSDEEVASIAGDVDSDNETEAETERLEISPQKGRMTLMVHDSARAHAISEPSNLSATSRPDLLPTDLLDDAQDQSDSSESDADELERSREASPTSLAGRKRKRDGQLSPTNIRASMEIHPQKKRSSMRLSPEMPRAVPLYSNGEAAEEALSSNEYEEALDAIEDATRPSMSPPTPQAVPAQGDSPEQVDMDDVIEPDNEEDEAEIAAKNEDEAARKRLALDSFLPIENLFAIFRDRVFNERWNELTAELETLQNPDTHHADFIAQRQVCDIRRDEKIRVEGIILKYKQDALAKKMLAQRATIFAQCAQQIRNTRDDVLTQLNSDFCQIQRERRQFKGGDSQFVIPFETGRAAQVENQTKYNKEVSLLSGIARYQGFPAAPDLKSARREDVDSDFAAMRIPNSDTNGRPFSFSAQIANSARADEIAAEQTFYEQTPWANPNHPALLKTRVVEKLPRLSLSTPSTTIQPWMMGGGPANAPNNSRSSIPPTQELRAPPYSKAQTPSTLDYSRRNDLHWKENGINKIRPSGTQSPFQRKTSDSTPLQLYMRNELPVGGYRTAPSLAPPAGSFGTPMARTPDRERDMGEEDRGRARDNYSTNPTPQTGRDARFGDSVASVGVR